MTMTFNDICDNVIVINVINDICALTLPPGTGVEGKMFGEYLKNIFKLRILHDLERAKWVNVVWYDYRELTIKGSTREKCGTGQDGVWQVKPMLLQTGCYSLLS